MENLKKFKQQNQILSKCDICEKDFNTIKKLKEHFKMVHNYHSDQIECNICTKVFAQKCKLNVHIKNTHQGSSKCHLCHKSLQICNLKIHLKEVHVGVQDYIHEFCRKSFSHANSSCKIHQDLGTKSKFCELCGKSFLNMKSYS